MSTATPDGVTVLDPLVRDGAYLAVGVQEPGRWMARWHVWHASGAYIGFATTPELVPLVIARHRTGH